MSRIITMSLFAWMMIVLVSCGQETAPEQTAQPAQKLQAASTPGSPASQPAEMTSSAAGATWNVPDQWTVQEKRPMRIATYNVQPASGDTESGECAIFFFGTGEGGSVEMNLARWKDQFSTADGKEAVLTQNKSTINGLAVTTTSISGTYLASMGPMFQSGAAKKNGYKMLGAIVTAPEGNVFIKFTGPEKTIDAASKEFNDMINSVRIK